jgi:dipeptidyl aminopeptidase/acylaminoacyl peptidase
LEDVGDPSAEVLLETRVSGRDWSNMATWSPDGRYLVAASELLGEAGDTTEVGNSVAYLDLQGPRKLQDVVPRRDPVHYFGLSPSPDGSWLAFVEDEPGKEPARIWVIPFPEGGQRRLVSKQGGVRPLWSPDGTRIYFLSTSEPAMLVVDVQTELEFRASEPRLLFRFPDEHLSHRGDAWDISPDGRLFVTYHGVGESLWRPPSHINIDEGFFEVLRDRANPRD